MRGTALSEGIGEILTPLPPMPQCQILIAKPPISVSTKFVYENLNLPSLSQDAHPNIDKIAKALASRDFYGVADNLGKYTGDGDDTGSPGHREIKEKDDGTGSCKCSG